jgi:hypothetical protein
MFIVIINVAEKFKPLSATYTSFICQDLNPSKSTTSPIFLSFFTRGSFPGGKARPGSDADHSPLSSAAVN